MKFRPLLLPLLWLFASPAFSQAAKDAALQKDIDLVIEELRFLHDLDQGIREYLDYGTFNEHVRDSIEALDESSVAAAQENLGMSKEARKLVWKHMLTPVDSLKAVRMLDLIRMYGFPSVPRLEQFSGKELDFYPSLILVHVPFSMAKKFLPVIEEEYLQGNLKNRCEYGYLLWHLNGRSDFSYMLDNGYKMNKKEDGSIELVSTCP